MPRLRDRLRARPVALRMSAGLPSAILVPKSTHHDAVGQPHDEAHIVLDQQDAQPLGLQAQQQRRQRRLLQMAQARGRLVEQQEPRIERQRAGDLDEALLAERAGFRRASTYGRQGRCAQADGRLRRAGGFPRRGRAAGYSTAVRPCRAHARRAPTFSMTLISGMSLTCWKVRAMPRAAMLARLGIADRAAVEQDVAGGQRQHAGDQVEDGALARAVRADQPDDLALLATERSTALTATSPPKRLRAPQTLSSGPPTPGACCRLAMARRHIRRRRAPVPAGEQAARRGHSPSRAHCSMATTSDAEHDGSRLAVRADEARQSRLQRILQHDHHAPRRARRPRRCRRRPPPP